MKERESWRLQVKCYSGTRSEERPVQFSLGLNTYRVRDILDQWYEPQGAFFKVLADDGNIYILRHRLSSGWTLEAFRRGGGEAGK